MKSDLNIQQSFSTSEFSIRELFLLYLKNPLFTRFFLKMKEMNLLFFEFHYKLESLSREFLQCSF